MTRLPTALMSLLLCASACTPHAGLWVWRHPDADYARQMRARDVAECEQYALDVWMDGPFDTATARDYGGWGSFDFDFCMQERGWHLEYEKP